MGFYFGRFHCGFYGGSRSFPQLGLETGAIPAMEAAFRAILSGMALDHGLVNGLLTAIAVVTEYFRVSEVGISLSHKSRWFLGAMNRSLDTTKAT